MNGEMNCFCSRPKSDCASCSVAEAKNNLGKEYWSKPEGGVLKQCFCTREDGDCKKCLGVINGIMADLFIPVFRGYIDDLNSMITGPAGDPAEEHF